MAPSGFKVIVVGGGPVGLTAAHALEKAGIDFVLLESRPEIVIDAGSNLVLSPLGLRALLELGIKESMDAVSTELGLINRLDHNGNNIGDVRIFEQLKDTNGTALTVVSRHNMTKVLYEQLSKESKNKLYASKKVNSIIPEQDGVQVVCEDGTSYAGSMVIGADGAHSRVRSLMRSLALEQGSNEVNAEKPFLTTYRALWIRMPMDGRLKTGVTCETHGEKIASQLFTGYDSAVMGLYERLEAPTRERQRFSRADQDALVARWDSLPLLPDGKLTLGEAYRARSESGLVSLEEGVVDHWSWNGRIVLAGDAAHKFTPSTGAGCNNGMIDVVALVNELYKLGPRIQSTTATAPSRDELSQVFQSYQDQRMDTVRAACEQSGRATAMATWETGIHKFIDRHIFSKSFVTKLLVGKGDQSPDGIYDFIPQRPMVAAA